MPVGTQATVKTLHPDEVERVGFRLVLANAFHLYLRPGPDVIAEAGGLHRFMGWPHALLTDSGGFQVFSLSELRKVSEEGVSFRSPHDGSSHFLTPEAVISVQELLGSDIMMPLDECLPYPCDEAHARESVRMTCRWAERSKDAVRGDRPVFGISQGGTYPDLRREGVERLLDIGFPGYAIGGVSVGETSEQGLAVVEMTAAWLPRDKPRYVMGVGEPCDMLRAIALGADMFDCVMPTRNARNGCAFTADGRLVVRNGRYARDGRPIEEGCACPVCARFTRSYVRHLFHAGEVLGLRLVTEHNLHFMMNLTRRAREAITQDRYDAFVNDFISRFQAGDERRTLRGER